MASHTDSISERSPLLAPPSGADSVRDKRVAIITAGPCSPQSHHEHGSSSRPIVVALLCLLLIFFLESGLTLLNLAESQIEEGIICRRFHPDVVDTVTDARCQDAAVQSELSTLQGWVMTFALIPGLFTAVPYGVAADRIGRRPILALSLLGILLVEGTTMIICRFPGIFPLRLMWLTCMLTFVGGGPYVFKGVIFAIVSDVTTEAQRSTAFFYIAAADLASRLLSGPVAFASLKAGEWLTVCLGLSLLAGSVLIVPLFPETHLSTAVEVEAPSHSDGVERRPSDELAKNRTLWTRISDVLELKQMATLIKLFFWKNKRVGLLLSSLIFTTLGNHGDMILQQYTRKRYEWSWAKIGLLSSVSVSVSLVLLVAVLPALSLLFHVRLGFSAIAKDALLVRAALLVLLVGAFGIGLSNSSGMLIVTLIIYSLGYGYDSSLRSLLVVLTGEQHTALLFMAINVLQNAGMLIAGPLLSWTFRAGLRWGGAWIGLPFIVMGCLLSCAACIVFGVPLMHAPAVIHAD